MMTEQQFSDLVNRIKALGYDESAASDFARLIGDTPALDSAGLTVVRDGETVLARLRLDD